MTEKELEHAIQGALDGTLSSNDCLILRGILKDNPQARALYYEHAALHHSLIYRITRFSQIDAAKSLADMRMQMQRSRINRFTFLTTVAALVVIIMIMKSIFDSSEPATFRTSANTLYQISSEHHNNHRQLNELPTGSSVSVTQGSFEFTLDNGTKAVLLAPAKFKLESNDSVAVYEGTAWFNVSADGKGFVAHTSEINAVDQGTEFGIIADPEFPDEIHVFSGAVDVSAIRRNGYNSQITRLTTGQAQKIDPHGTFLAIIADPSAFLSKLPDNSSSSLLFNGNFESGTDPKNLNFGMAANSAILPGWRFGKDISVSLCSKDGSPGHGDGNNNALSSTKDKQIGFINAGYDSEVGGLDDSIWQTIKTEPGGVYQVSYEMGGFFADHGTLEISVNVVDGTNPSKPPFQLHKSVKSGSSPKDNGYDPPTKFSFTAKSGLTTLIFTETSPDTRVCSPAIDNVKVGKSDD